MLRQRQRRQFTQRWVHIHQFHKCIAGNIASPLTGRRNDQRHSRGDLIVRRLAPYPMLAQMPAVIAPKNNNRLLPQAQGVQLIENLTDLGVNIAYAGQIRVDQIAGIGIGQIALLGNPCSRTQLERSVQAH